MADISTAQWESLQKSINTCLICSSQNLLQQPDCLPGRPWPPQKTGRTLLISEAPPVSGGFWEMKVEDDLRKNLQGFLSLPSANSHQSCLENFMVQGFFLLQTIKWPIAPRINKKSRNFNQLGPAQQRILIEHSAAAHLKAEIDLLSPSRILAMGNAAWQACQVLSPISLKGKGVGVEVVRQLPLKFFGSQGEMPLKVTFLPLRRNLRFPERNEFIQKDFAEFLSWGQALHSHIPSYPIQYS